MSLKTREEYLDSLRQQKTVVYFMGERIENVVDSPYLRPHIESAAMTYHLAHDPVFQDLMVVESSLTGKKINRFTHIHQSTEDLVKKVKMMRMIGQRTGSCFQRCVGFDALNALYTVTYEIDQKYGTEYHDRIKKYLEYVQENDLMCAGAMTDPKGDRSKKPSQQADPDLYTRVVEKRPDGIVVRGAKAHQTGIVNSHEFIVMPTTALGPDDADYAVACAIPVDAPGVIHIFGRQTNDLRRSGGIDAGGRSAWSAGSLTVMTMCSYRLGARVHVRRDGLCWSIRGAFCSCHRQNYGGCQVAVGDIIIGAVPPWPTNGDEGITHTR